MHYSCFGENLQGHEGAQRLFWARSGSSSLLTKALLSSDACRSYRVLGYTLIESSFRASSNFLGHLDMKSSLIIPQARRRIIRGQAAQSIVRSNWYSLSASDHERASQRLPLNTASHLRDAGVSTVSNPDAAFLATPVAATEYQHIIVRSPLANEVGYSRTNITATFIALLEKNSCFPNAP